MCGRYAAFRGAQLLADEFAVEHITDEAAGITPSWNVAPTTLVRIVVERTGADGAVLRSLQAARWGLVPPWSPDARGGARMINARVETLADKRSFAAPLGARRCLVPADGYYEWCTSTPPQSHKQPYYLRPATGSFAFAGLFEFWRDRSRASDDPTRWLTTVTIITTAASTALEAIHHRMPVAVPASRWDPWLDPTVGAEQARSLLDAPAPDVVAVPVSRAVGSVAQQGPDLIRPIAGEDAPIA